MTKAILARFSGPDWKRGLLAVAEGMHSFAASVGMAQRMETGQVGGRAVGREGVGPGAP
jgi:hypothetical protein